MVNGSAGAVVLSIKDDVVLASEEEYDAALDPEGEVISELTEKEELSVSVDEDSDEIFKDVLSDVGATTVYGVELVPTEVMLNELPNSDDDGRELVLL